MPWLSWKKCWKKLFNGESELAAAINLYCADPDLSLIPVFIEAMSSTENRLRAGAAYYAPSDILHPELISALKGMIRTETYRLAALNATNKLLECYGITRELVGKDEFSRFTKGFEVKIKKIKNLLLKSLKNLIRKKREARPSLAFLHDHTPNA